MAKKDKNEDEYKDENLDNSANQDDEDFGLPDLDDDSNTDEPISFDDEEEEHKAEEEPENLSDIQEPSDSPYLDRSDEDVDEPYEEDPYGEDSDYVDEGAAGSAYVAPKKSSAAPIIVTLVIILLLALTAVYFIFIREPEPPKVAEVPVKDTTSYVVEKPVEVVEPEIVEPTEPKTGEVNILSSRTGRSYVVVGSFFDDDLAKDYAANLAKSGENAYIIPPFGKSKFTRVAIQETSSFAAANSRATELAGQFKEQPWPLKY